MAIYSPETKEFYCECGCGEVCAPWSSYSKAGHNVRVHNPTDDPAVRKAISDTVTELWRNGDYIGRQEASGKLHIPIELLLEYLDLHCACGCGQLVEHLRSRFLPGHWSGTKEASELFSSKERCLKISKGLRNFYRDNPTSINRSGSKPNRMELELLDYSELEFPSLFKYVGDKSFWIGNRNPDFISQSAKLVIELNGECWHDGESDEDFTIHYSQYGYKCLVVWASNLMDIAIQFNEVSDWIRSNRDMVVFGQ